jgi:hypothetical protein
MLRVYARRRWYLCPDSFFCSLEEYIAASRTAPAADVRTYQAEVAVFEFAHRKRRCEALQARAKRSAASELDAGERSARACIQEGARVQRPFVQSVRTYELLLKKTSRCARARVRARSAHARVRMMICF